MPAAWQKWMPLHIDKLWSSPEVQRMHGWAFKGYMALITAQWQSDDCSLTESVEELAIISRLSDEQWAEHSQSILRKFPSAEEGGLRNSTCYEQWMEAKARYEEGQLAYEQLRAARSVAGKYGAQVKEKNRNQKLVTNQANDKQSLSKPQAELKQTSSNAQAKSSFTYTETHTETKTKKPSGDKRQPDDRHVPFRDALIAENSETPWDASDAKALSNLLGANPKLGLDGFQRLLGHRRQSEGVNLSLRPRAWLERVTDYAGGPLDRFNKPKEERNGSIGNSAGRVQRSLDAWDRAAERRGVSIAESNPQANAGLLPAPGVHGGNDRGLSVRHGTPSGEIQPSFPVAGVAGPTAPSGPEVLPPSRAGS